MTNIRRKKTKLHHNLNSIFRCGHNNFQQFVQLMLLSDGRFDLLLSVNGFLSLIIWWQILSLIIWWQTLSLIVCWQIFIFDYLLMDFYLLYLMTAFIFDSLMADFIFDYLWLSFGRLVFSPLFFHYSYFSDTFPLNICSTQSPRKLDNNLFSQIILLNAASC